MTSGAREFSMPITGKRILGDSGAVSGGGKKSKRARKRFGAGKSLNGREKDSGAEKSRTTLLLVVLDFSAPEFFSRPLRLFPAPTNCPWVSEDAWRTEGDQRPMIPNTSVT